MLWGKQVEFARPYVKWSVEPHRAEDVPAAIEEGYHRAMAPPRGPVLISVPMDGMDEPCPPVYPREVSRRTSPDPAAVARAAAALDRGTRIAIVVGSEADDRAGSPLLVALAERLQAAVFLAPEAYRVGFPTDHSLYQGALPPAQAALAERLRPYDTVLVVGAPVFVYFPYVPGPTVKPGTELVQITSDPAMAARALVGSSVLGDVASAVAQLLALVKARPRTAAQGRPAPAALDEHPGALGPAAVFGALTAALPPRAILSVEAPSWESFLLERVPLRDPGSFYATASGSLGFALSAAVGLALAEPDRPVIAIVGDGSAQYTIQGLYTAARERVPVTFVILDNQQYGILKSFERFIERSGAPGLDLGGIDFEGLARGYGLPYRRVVAEGELKPTFEAAFASRTPNLVHVAIDRFVPDLL
jgi:benzoylformate decarboxylase